MKRLLLSLALLPAVLFAQDCQNPMPQNMFQQNFNQVAVMPTNEAKLIKATAFLNGACMLSEQVKQMAQLFNNDAPRLEYCKQAYLHTFDRANFYVVYDAFSQFSMMMRLHDYVQGANTMPPPPPVNSDPVFPNLMYPSANGYKGKTGCPGPVITPDVFKAAAKNVAAQPTDESKTVAIQNACDQYCISMEMMMKLTSLIQNESMREKLMINNLYHLYDMEHFDSAAQLFPTDGVKNEWLAYAKSFVYPPPPPPVCITSDEDFKKIMADLDKQHFSDDKMKTFNVISKDRCFSTEQVRKISKQFPFGEEKMKVFKSSYAKCTDRENYYKLVDELSFSSEKDDLRNFIKNN